MPDGKRVVNEKTIVETEQESAPAQEVNMDTVVNDASEMGHTLPLHDEISPSRLDWSDMAPVDEFDRIAEKRGVDSLGGQEQSPQGVGELTDSMSKRITKMKQQEQSKLADKDNVIAEKDSIIAAREQQINQLTQMAADYQKLQSSYVPPQGDVTEVDNQITEMDQRLQDEGDTYTAAEVAQHMQKRQDLQMKRSETANAQSQAQNLLKQQQNLRTQSDQFVRENYDFINDSKSEYYQTLKTQAYPVLESIIGPQFKNHPQDMVLAAELSKLMVDANKYQQIMGNQPAPRQQAAPMAGNVTPQSRPNQRQQSTFRQAANDLRGGGVQGFADMLSQRGHTWRP